MAGKGRALLSLTAGAFPCSLGCEESFSPPLSCLGEVRQSWSCWQVVSVHLSRVLWHLFLRTLHVNLWKHQLVNAGIPIVYLKKSQVDSYLERVFSCWKFGILLKGLLKVPAPAMASSGSSTAGTWPDPAVLGYKLIEKNKIEPSDCTIWC